jgi:hypothetical protein
MYQLASGILGGTLAVFGMGLFVPEISGGSFAALRSPSGEAAAALQTTYESVNREFKGDRLIVCTASEVSTPAAGCRVRIGEGAGTGTNVTVMGKTVTPVSVGRDSVGTIPQPGQITPTRSKKIELPEGCESAVSVAADPVLAQTASRCVS